MRTQTTGSKTERNGTMTSMTINEGTLDNNRKLSDAQLKQGERGIVIGEILIALLISGAIWDVVLTGYGILGAIFDWFD